jgi:FkbM family methyltransferase
MFSVRQKMLIARQVNHALRLARRCVGRGMQLRCRRHGVNWALDLDEGIDLCIYLQGAYEPRSLRAYERVIRPGDVVVDIGANIGAHTLQFARLVGPAGHVFAFEPTDFAIAKLRANLALNPDLGPRVTLQQSFLVANQAERPPTVVASSWPVAHHHEGLHPDHLGKSQPLAAATTITGDEYCEAAGITRIDFVKIDVDGYEFPVLQGFQRTLRRCRPKILIEIAPYFYGATQAADFERFIGFLRDLDYDFSDANSGRRVPDTTDGLRKLITPGGGMNALLRPRPARA